MWPHLSLLALLTTAKLQPYKGGGGGLRFQTVTNDGFEKRECSDHTF